MPNAKLQPCPDCGHQVSTAAKSCPSCGRALRGEYRRAMGSGCLLQGIGLTLLFLTLGMWEPYPGTALATGALSAALIITGFIRARR